MVQNYGENVVKIEKYTKWNMKFVAYPETGIHPPILLQNWVL